MADDCATLCFQASRAQHGQEKKKTDRGGTLIAPSASVRVVGEGACFRPARLSFGDMGLVVTTGCRAYGVRREYIA